MSDQTEVFKRGCLAKIMPKYSKYFLAMAINGPNLSQTGVYDCTQDYLRMQNVLCFLYIGK